MFHLESLGEGAEVWVGPLQEDTANRDLILLYQLCPMISSVGGTAYRADLARSGAIYRRHVVLHRLLVDERAFVSSSSKSHDEHPKYQLCVPCSYSLGLTQLTAQSSC